MWYMIKNQFKERRERGKREGGKERKKQRKKAGRQAKEKRKRGGKAERVEKRLVDSVMWNSHTNQLNPSPIPGDGVVLLLSSFIVEKT